MTKIIQIESLTEEQQRRDRTNVTGVAIGKLWREIQTHIQGVFLDYDNPMLDEFIVQMERDKLVYLKDGASIDPVDYAKNSKVRLAGFDKAIFRAKIIRDILRPNAPTVILR